MAANTENLEHRLERLERSHRRLKAMWALSVFALLGAYPAIEAISNTAMLHGIVKAKQFVVDGSNGKPYARLNSYGLHLYNDKGKDVADLVATGKPEASTICELERFRKQPKAGNGVGAKPCPKHRPTVAHLALKNSNGKPIVKLGVWPDSSLHAALKILSPAIHPADSSVMTSKALNLATSAGRTTVQAGSMYVNSPSSWPANGISLDASNKDGGPNIKITDKKGTTRVAIGRTELTNTRTDATTNRSPSSIVLFDKKGRVIWEKP